MLFAQVGSHADGLDVAPAIAERRHGRADGDALGASANGVGGVLDVGAEDDFGGTVRIRGGGRGKARGRGGVDEQSGADAELGVRACERISFLFFVSCCTCGSRSSSKPSPVRCMKERDCGKRMRSDW